MNIEKRKITGSNGSLFIKINESFRFSKSEEEGLIFILMDLSPRKLDCMMSDLKDRRLRVLPTKSSGRT